MNTASVYDFESINARAEEIKRERIQAPAEHAVQTAVEQSLEVMTLTNPQLPYLGWDIYAPVNVSPSNG